MIPDNGAPAASVTVPATLDDDNTMATDVAVPSPTVINVACEESWVFSQYSSA